MKTKKKTILPGHVIYLLVLLGAVLIYMLVIYPKLNAAIAQQEAQYNSLTTQNNMLAEYEHRLSELATQTKEAQDVYDTDTTLLQPAAFTNLISEAADKAGVILDSVQVEAQGDTSLSGGYTGTLHMASVQITIPDTVASAAFLQEMESYTGAGIYVTDIVYQPASAGNPAAGQAGGGGDALTAVISYYTVEK